MTGPPGTGKTQVVTALLGSAVYNHQTVLFASNNNMAVDAAYERLGKHLEDVGNWVMRLGNLNKRKLCFQSLSSLLEQAETSDFSDLSFDVEQGKLFQLERDITKIRTSLKKARRLQEDISELHDKEKYFERKLPQNWLDQFTDIEAPVFLDIKKLKKLERHSASGFWLSLRKMLGVEHFESVHNVYLTALCQDNKYLSEYEEWLLCGEKKWRNTLKKAQETVQYLKWHQNWAICIKKRRLLERKIVKCALNIDFFAFKQQKSQVSQKLFEKWWFINIRHGTKEAQEAFRKYFQDIDDYSGGRHKRLERSLNALKQFFPIWMTTTQSTNSIMPPQEALFDLVVIDEAGQCDIPSILPLLYRAKRAVVIGDPHQLKHITSIKDNTEHAISKALKIEGTVMDWSFNHRSAFDRSSLSVPEENLSFLKQHYRCHPDIIRFSNLNFYEGKLVEQIALSQFQNRLPIEENGLIWHHIKTQIQETKGGAWNPVEVEKDSPHL